MFNVEVKEKYLLDFPEKQKRIQTSYLNKISGYEEEIDKDIGEFTKAEIESLFKNLLPSIPNIKSRYNLVNSIKIYFKWYNKNIRDNSAENSDINVTNLDASNAEIKYYKSLDGFLSDIFNVIYSKTLSSGVLEKDIRENWDLILAKYNTPIATLLLLWVGLSLSEISDLKDVDVCVEQKSVVVGDKTIQIEEPIMDILAQIKNTKKYLNTNNTLGEYETSIYFTKKQKRANLAGVKNKKLGEQFLRNKIWRDINNNSTGIVFNVNVVRENGMFVRAAQKVKDDRLKIKIRDPESSVYYDIFDEWVRNVSPWKFQYLKKQFRIFLRDLQKQ